MGRYRVEGGYPIAGEMETKGSKNGVLPILAAVLLTESEVILHHCPLISDFFLTLEILKSLGCRIKRDGRTVIIDASFADKSSIENEIVQKMRSSIIFMGALLGKYGEACVGYPGGCEIGVRPIDLHLKAFREMGVTIRDEKGFIYCTSKSINGVKINLDYPSVGATENILLLASKAKGQTIVYNAACEPEIVQLAEFLNACGAKITGAGTECIVIDGVQRMHGTEFTIFPDRIEAGTLLCAAAITGGEIHLKKVKPDDMRQTLLRLDEVGCKMIEGQNEIYLKAPRVLRPVDIIYTGPYPNFPTDMQPQMMSVLTLARGTSIISETVFEARFKHIAELCRLGADIHVEGQTAVIKGVKKLQGCHVIGRDLRGTAALILAGLSAEGETVVENSQYVERGYEEFEKTLTALGAKIRLEKSGDRYNEKEDTFTTR
ncbi:MAG: UDP-N-acetylglucosamine 1-carboxyvinyltransferase [Epulopiscium sp.]|nr:UDP-N-acetylglucosamine 1-carboxyvinyltransferase [Candidatus Epulonipiscium sp.]